MSGPAGMNWRAVWIIAALVNVVAFWITNDLAFLVSFWGCLLVVEIRDAR